MVERIAERVMRWGADEVARREEKRARVAAEPGMGRLFVVDMGGVGKGLGGLNGGLERLGGYYYASGSRQLNVK